jgi:probable F420-dependent oxidoreductase
MATFRVGVQLQPQQTTVEALRRGWRAADELGVDSIWVWDHFFPLYGDPAGTHFEAWTLLAAMAVETRRARIGTLVTGNSYRNPDLLADMARTVDHLSGGRAVLGIGAGWAERDYDEYGYTFGTAGSRLRDLETSLERIRARRTRLVPPPLGVLPILIGGGGEKVTLRLVAEHADAWNYFPPVENWGRKNAILDEWCAKVGRDPGTIERTVHLSTPPRDEEVDAWLRAGASHLIVGIADPFDVEPIGRLVSLAAG